MTRRRRRRAPSARARTDGRAWRLSGVKTAVPALPRADLVLVPATVTAGRAGGVGRGRGSGRARPARCWCSSSSRQIAGSTVQPQELTDGNGADAGRLVLDGVRLDDSRVLGEPGRGGGPSGLAGRRGAPSGCARSRRAWSSGRLS